MRKLAPLANHTIPTQLVFLLATLSLLSLACRIVGVASEAQAFQTSPTPESVMVITPAIATLASLLEGTQAASGAPIPEVTLAATDTQSAPPTPEIVPPGDISFNTGESGSGSLYGRVFFDYNANGRQEDLEPGILGVKVCLGSQGGEHCTSSEMDGAYSLERIPTGAHQVYFSSPTDGPSAAFRYLSVWQDWLKVPAYTVGGTTVPEQGLSQTRVSAVEDPLQVDIELNKQLDVGLMQGYLTDPLACMDREKITHFQGYDLDPEVGSVRNYLGENSPGSFTAEGPHGTMDNHLANDWGSDLKSIIGLPVRAAAPGIVHYTGPLDTSHGKCLVVGLVHPDTGQRSGYVHLDKILVQDGQELQRGQILGTLGKTCTEWPHLHFYFQTSWDYGNSRWESANPYRDMQDPASYTYWTRDNAPVCLNFSQE